METINPGLGRAETGEPLGLSLLQSQRKTAMSRLSETLSRWNEAEKTTAASDLSALVPLLPVGAQRLGRVHMPHPPQVFQPPTCCFQTSLPPDFLGPVLAPPPTFLSMVIWSSIVWLRQMLHYALRSHSFCTSLVYLKIMETSTTHVKPVREYHDTGLAIIIDIIAIIQLI